tara:strand:+ start:151 stop:675 length:525 start_codon:yes stop_codon:yes gene_type:complete
MSGAIILGALFLIFCFIAFSALGALILWGCARAIGKIEGVTYLNSWGLFWILVLAGIPIGILFNLTTYAITGHSSFDLSGNTDPLGLVRNYFGIYLSFMILYFIIQILIALIITKGFWKCSLRQAFMTHLIPIIMYTILMLVSLIFSFVVIDELQNQHNNSYQNNQYNNYDYTW